MLILPAGKSATYYFLLVEATNGFVPIPGVDAENDIVFEYSVNGGAFTPLSGLFLGEISDGWYIASIGATNVTTVAGTVAIQAYTLGPPGESRVWRERVTVGVDIVTANGSGIPRLESIYNHVSASGGELGVRINPLDITAVWDEILEWAAGPSNELTAKELLRLIASHSIGINPVATPTNIEYADSAGSGKIRVAHTVTTQGKRTDLVIDVSDN
jgi:hypothetical protein